MKNGLFTTLGGIFAIVLSVQNAVAAGALWVGGDNENDITPTYYFASGYPDVPSASNAARDACRDSQNLCVARLSGASGGLDHDEAYALYGHYIPGGQVARGSIADGEDCLSEGNHGVIGEVSALECARRHALEFCLEERISPCNELLAVVDTGDSNPRVRSIHVQGISRTSNSGGGGSSSNAGVIIGGAAVVGLGIWLYNSNTPDLPDAETSFIPVAEYADGDLSVGGRLDWQKGRMSAFWEAGDSLHGSGLQYDGDFWTAAFSESVQGETADYDVSLSADWTGGIWKVSPEFAAHSVYEKGEFATTNSFRINGELLYDDWRFSASGSKTQMHLSAVLEF